MKKVLAMLLVAATLMGAVACGGAKTEEAAPAEGTTTEASSEAAKGTDGKFRIAFINVGKENRFQKWVMSEYEKKIAAEYPDFEFIIYESEQSAEKQVDNIENAVASQVDMILFYPYDSYLAISALNNAVAAGIPVFCVGQQMEDDGVLPFVDSDMTGGSKILADYGCEVLPENAKVAILKGTAGNMHSEIRYNAWIDTLAADRPDITIVDTQYADWQKDEAMRYTEDWLQAYPDLTGVIACNDDMAMGAAEAAKMAGKSDFYTFGFDGLGDACLAIQSGDMTATMLQNAQALVEESLKVAKMVYDGEDISDQHILVDCVLINGDNIDEWVARHKESGVIQ